MRVKGRLNNASKGSPLDGFGYKERSSQHLAWLCATNFITGSKIDSATVRNVLQTLPVTIKQREEEVCAVSEGAGSSAPLKMSVSSVHLQRRDSTRFPAGGPGTHLSPHMKANPP